MKRLIKLFKNKADEREKQEFMRVERIAFWVMFYVTTIAFIVQLVLPGYEPRHIAGEIIVLLVGCVVAIVGYIRKGLWSPRIKMSVKSNLLFSLAAGVILAGIAVLRLVLSDVPAAQGGQSLFAIVVLIQFAFTFALTFGLLTICAALVKRRKAKLEVEAEDTD